MEGERERECVCVCERERDQQPLCNMFAKPGRKEEYSISALTACRSVCRYESMQPAIMENANGVILVFNPNHADELDTLRDL